MNSFPNKSGTFNIYRLPTGVWIPPSQERRPVRLTEGVQGRIHRNNVAGLGDGDVHQLVGKSRRGKSEGVIAGRQSSSANQPEPSV